MRKQKSLTSIKGYTMDEIKALFAAAEREAAKSVIKTFTVDELIEALREAAATAPEGGATRVRVGDWEGNLSANGVVETLEVKYDPATSHVTIYCDPNEC